MRYLTIYMCFLLTGIIGCTMPQIVQPLHLYDLTDGTTIEVFFHSTSRDHGFISSKDSSITQFQGEYNFSSDRMSGWLPPLRAEAMDKSKILSQTNPEDFAEAYGFGKNSQARPVGTGVIVGKDGAVIEIIFYRISADLQTGDGIGRDNRGRYYRIFLSTE